MKMNHKYIVTLTEEERNELRDLINKGQTQGYRIKHAQILLKQDEIPENQEWTYAKIKEAYHHLPNRKTICSRRTGGGIRTQGTGQPAQKGEWTGRSAYHSHRLLRSAGGAGAVDIAADCR